MGPRFSWLKGAHRGFNRTSEANLNLGGDTAAGGNARRDHAVRFSALRWQHLGADALTAERSSGRRTVDQQIHSYLRDVEQSLLEASVHEAQLEEALRSRTTIGQAVGLLMAQEGFTSEEAFAKLVSVSQNANVKLREIAHRYVDTWEEKVRRGGQT